MPARPGPGRHPFRHGFTLVEVAVTCAIAGLLLALAWPSLRPAQLHSGRADAVHALLRLEHAQARHHALHGLYAADLQALGGAAATVSPQGHYAIALDAAGGDSWRAHAQARAGSPQAADRDCATLSIEVRRGFATLGPSPRCWNR